MRKFSLSLLSLSLGMALMPFAHAETSAQQQLLDQVRLGESAKRDDLVRQSLYRLELIAPDDPQVIAARMRYALRQGDTASAKKQLERLKTLAPQSDAYKTSLSEMQLSSGDGRQALQQARLQVTTGHIPEGIALYDKLFNGTPPDGDIAVEYWTAVAGLPARHNEAVNKLKALNATSPGNVQLQTTLAKMLFRDNRNDEGYAVLQQMAKSSAGRGTAADIWYDQIKNQPVSDGSVKSLQRFLTLFTTGELADEARGQLAEQQKQLADPVFHAKAEQQAKAAEAVKVAASQPQTWEIVWPLIRKGDAALKTNNLDQAQRFYQQAQRVDNSNSYAVLGLGDVAMARHDTAAAERYYQQAMRLDRGNSNAVRGLANIYRAESPEKATAFIDGLSASQRKSIDDIERSLTNDRLSKQAEALENQGQWAQAAEIQRRRLALNPGDVWVTYRLAKDLSSAGQRSEADNLMLDLARKKSGDPDQVYAYSLYLSGNGQDMAALSHLNQLPKSQWNSNIQELADRLQADQILQKANLLRDNGHEDQAIALLKQQPASTRFDLTQADWAQQRGDTATAIAQYNAVLAKDATNDDARLGLAEVYAADGNQAAAREQLAQIKAPAAGEIPSLNTQRRVALVDASVGDNAKAQQIFSSIVPQAKAQPASMESALVLRDNSRFQVENGSPQQALEGYKDAMVAAGITPTRPQDNDSFTRLTRNDPKDDWLKRGLRSDAADLYRQQDVNVTLEHDYWGSSGTGGYSDLKAHTTMLQADAPLADGRMFFRSDYVNMNAGTFSTNSDGGYSPRWGTCSELTCYSGDKSQSDRGASIAVGWRNDTWDMDIGTTPMGFDVVDVVGGLSYSNSIGSLGYTVEGHRRPISSSLLAFGGQKDPNTGTTWGGVRANGGGVSLSYDKGEANGVWASLSADTLTGKNVEDNWRARWMAGYYYKVINENDRRVTVGLNNMIWHYDKDLSGYTLGQGGYYSPQQYLSFAVPVNWRQRTENWSWELGGSVSWSHSKTNDQARYPLQNLLPANFEGGDTVDGGSSSNGIGYTAHALIERRVTSNWFIGAAIDIQQAKDYTPSHALLYVRYSAAGWQGDMDLPPQPLIPYADW
ncbi:cellulose synthase complex outer membrane protein BcsC [Enterobacter sp. CC120223-11]|uniref:cellulose synthase complex outer membrane protein BcsC n=1 Tax=Enterobacter sp. CC120223-11 TaxID=1378073 RepID=UPI000BC4EEFB|nr:cellulose synthase complex outer membrane protein BcsC [Enterobacter sp. CC120223-11]SNY66278.1 Lipopolysaccharide biosynthesis regulator YciM, contains six TPR domains and a predicted metal-binding C-terminal domain [Enterobacter sp. CC120223-11]